MEEQDDKIVTDSAVYGDVRRYYARKFARRALVALSILILPLFCLSGIASLRLAKYKKRFKVLFIIYAVGFVASVATTVCWVIDFSRYNSVEFLILAIIIAGGVSAALACIVSTINLIKLSRKSDCDEVVENVSNEVLLGDGKSKRKRFIKDLVVLSKKNDAAGFADCVAAAHAR